MQVNHQTCISLMYFFVRGSCSCFNMSCLSFFHGCHMWTWNWWAV